MNMLLVLSDQHNAKVMGYKDHPDAITPNFDRMAREGVRFENAITVNPICTPSRICYLSGQYPHNHGHYGNSGHIFTGLPGVLGHFRERGGYVSAAMGKIHCPEYWVEDQCDVFHETVPNCSIEGRSRSYAKFLKERGKEQFEDHTLLPEFADSPWANQSMEGRPTKLTFEETQEGWSCDEAKRFMDERKAKDEPFIMHLSFPRPHQCTSPSQEFWDLYDGKELTLPPNADYDMDEAGKAPHLKARSAEWRDGAPERALLEPKTYEAFRMRKLRGYLAAVSMVDHAMGQILDYLEASGLKDDTVVMYSADHGDYACEHGILEKAPGLCSDAITHVPMIWWGANENVIKPGHVVDELVETTDVANTFCSLAGMPELETADGKDISHLLRGESGEVHRIAVTEFAWSKSVRKGKYRLIFYPLDMFKDEYPDGFGELYDLEADPWEMKNLYFDPQYDDVVRDMKEELLEWLVRHTRPATTLCVAGSVDKRQALRRYKTEVNRDGKIHPDRLDEAGWKDYV